MIAIGERIRTLRKQKGLSQGDIEKSVGLLRCYTSRVEHGNTTPALDTLDRYAQALGVHLYELFYEGNEPISAPDVSPRRNLEELAAQPGKDGLDARFLLKIKTLLDRISQPDREILVKLAKDLATRDPQKGRGARKSPLV